MKLTGIFDSKDAKDGHELNTADLNLSLIYDFLSEMKQEDTRLNSVSTLKGWKFEAPFIKRFECPRYFNLKLAFSRSSRNIILLRKKRHRL